MLSNKVVTENKIYKIIHQEIILKNYLNKSPKKAEDTVILRQDFSLALLTMFCVLLPFILLRYCIHLSKVTTYTIYIYV